MVNFVHSQLHALHLAPGVALGAFRHALLEAFFAPQGLIGLHRCQQFAHFRHGGVVFREFASRHF